MPSYTPVSEDYSIGRPITGDMRLYDLKLTGWGALNFLQTKTDRGRLWVKLVGATLSLHSAPAMASGDAVASGNVSAGAVTLAAANTSGLTGTAKVDASADSTLSVILSYATEDDLADAYGIGLANELDNTGAYRGRDVRFESVLKKAKRDVDAKLRDDYAPKLPLKDDNTPDMTVISDPWQDNIVRAQAMIGAAVLCELRGPLDPAFYSMGKDLRARANGVIQSRRLALDYDADATVDRRAVNVQRLILG